MFGSYIFISLSLQPQTEIIGQERGNNRSGGGVLRVLTGKSSLSFGWCSSIRGGAGEDEENRSSLRYLSS